MDQQDQELGGGKSVRGSSRSAGLGLGSKRAVGARVPGCQHTGSAGILCLEDTELPVPEVVANPT